MKTPHCSLCDRTGHYKTFCTYRTLNGRIPTSGKYRAKWLVTKKKWFKDNTAESYTCYLCGKFLLPNETTLDHVIPRSRAPELRYEFSNLRPCCWVCNSEKGSKVLD